MNWFPTIPTTFSYYIASLIEGELSIIKSIRYSQIFFDLEHVES